MRHISFGLILLFCLAFWGCEKQGDKQTNQSPAGKKQGILENLTLQSDNGSELIINEIMPKEHHNFKNIEPKKENTFKNLIVTSSQKNIKVLLFFTTWCDPCKGVIPHLENLQKQFGEQITLYGIPIDDLVGEVENFKELMQIFNNENNVHLSMILDKNRARLFSALGGIEGVPLIALYDQEGKYIIHYLGAIPEEMVEFDLSQNLAKIKAQ